MMIKYQFHAEEATDQCVEWIRSYFDEAGCDKAVVGISGGKDSSVVAALCVAALGKGRVVGVMMPQDVQPDIHESFELVHFLDIPNITIDIGNATREILDQLDTVGISYRTSYQLDHYKKICVTDQTMINLPARIRMATLFAVAQSVNGRVANTCNLSENWIGYSTLFGDNAGQFAPIAQFTVQEVKEIGRVLGLPECLIEKTPSDGLCGKSDEENLGFTYEVLDRYIRTRSCRSSTIRAKIEQLHESNRFKEEIVNIPCCYPTFHVFQQNDAIIPLEGRRDDCTIQ